MADDVRDVVVHERMRAIAAAAAPVCIFVIRATILRPSSGRLHSFSGLTQEPNETMAILAKLL